MSDVEVENGPLTIDQAVEVYAKRAPATKDQSAEEDSASEADSAEELVNNSDEDASEEIEENDDADSEEEASDEADAAPETPLPRSWAAEDAAIWAKLTPEARVKVAAREADRDRAVAKAAQERSELGKTLQNIAARYEEIAPQAASDFERRWGGATPEWWQSLLDADERDGTNNFSRSKLAFETERDAALQAQAESWRVSELSFKRFVADQAELLPEVAPELADPKEGAARRQKTYAFLHEQGFSADDLKFTSAAELGIAYDAMRFREASRRAKAEAATPKKQPATPTPKAVKPSGQGDPSSMRALKQLEAKFTKSGSIDDAVALMQARRRAQPEKR